MLHLYKANLRRLLGNIYFIGGCLIALAVTYLFSAQIFTISFMNGMKSEGRMFFVSAAMVAFFTIIIPVYNNMEYGDGTIRNKIIAGYSQTQIYMSLLLAYFTMELVMWGCYLLAGFAGGAKPSGYMIVSNLVLLFAVANYIATMMIISFRIKNLIAAVIAAMLTMNLCFNAVLFGNALLMVTNGFTQKIMSWVYNISALGQWFARTGFADDIANPGAPVQILISCIIVTGLTILGVTNIDKRDLA
ncbi:MAG: hypothetical protein K6E18_01570 [Lachnospiraceae bacterium]|nr:hypothetical protein [Lachnospiraceae bacterium]